MKLTKFSPLFSALFSTFELLAVAGLELKSKLIMPMTNGLVVWAALKAAGTPGTLGLTKLFGAVKTV